MSPLAVSPITQLEEIDEKLISLLSVAQIDIDEINRFISQREQCLKNIQSIKLVPEEKSWSLATQKAEYIHALLSHHKLLAAQVTQSFVTGRKAAKAYKRFE